MSTLEIIAPENLIWESYHQVSLMMTY